MIELGPSAALPRRSWEQPGVSCAGFWLGRNDWVRLFEQVEAACAGEPEISLPPDLVKSEQFRVALGGNRLEFSISERDLVLEVGNREYVYTLRPPLIHQLRREIRRVFGNPPGFTRADEARKHP